MSWKNDAFKNFKLYAVTDLSFDDPDLIGKIDAAYRGGADIVQLRSKKLTDQILYRAGLKIREVADQHKKLFFVNDRLDLAVAVAADGLHLGQDDLPVAIARRMAAEMDRSFFIGKSTHSLEQAVQAEKEKPDYIGVGPVFETPTKPGCQPVGLKLVAEVHRIIKIPFVAIGGIDAQNLEQVLAAGAERVAVVRAIFGEKNSYEATRRLRSKIENFQPQV